MNSSTYNQLSIFISIVQEEGVRPAARKLEMAAPSVSQALKQLEKQVGLPLITRTTRQMELTDAGRLLYERSLPLVSELDETLEQVKQLNQVPSGKLRITLPIFAFTYFLQPLYAKFCKKYPEIDLEISLSDATVNIIKDGFDAGIRFAHKIEEGMVSVRLTPPLVQTIFASPEYLEANGTPETPEELSTHTLISYRYLSSNQLAPLMVTEDGNSYPVKMPRGIIVNHPDLMMDAAEQGLGVAAILEPIAKDAIAAGKIAPILESYSYSYPGLHLYFPRHSEKANRIRVLVDFLKANEIDKW